MSIVSLQSQMQAKIVQIHLTFEEQIQALEKRRDAAKLRVQKEYKRKMVDLGDTLGDLHIDDESNNSDDSTHSLYIPDEDCTDQSDHSNDMEILDAADLPDSLRTIKKEFPCNVQSCRKQFDTAAERKKHRDQCHGKTSKRQMPKPKGKAVSKYGIFDFDSGYWKCKRCDKLYMSRVGCRYHSARVHHTESLHLCHRCNHIFVLKSGLQYHVKHHCQQV